MEKIKGMDERSSGNPSTTITNRKLNDLPEELLLHILSFLPTLDSVRTSLISQKWRPLWSRVPALNFNYQLFPPHEPPSETPQSYAEFVDRILVSRSDSSVHTFRLSFLYNDDYFAHVDSWVRSAVTRLRARELYLDFFMDPDFHNDEIEIPTYDFPFSVLRNGCVEKLGLARCDLVLPAKLSTMRFGSIGSMVLDMVNLSDKAVEDLILGCPNLEVLELLGSYGFKHLKIRSTRLKRLVVALGYSYDDPKFNQAVLVDCPNLSSIDYDDCGFNKFVLKNAASLVAFRVDFMHRIEQSYLFWSKVVRLLQLVPNIKHLSVQNWWYKFLTSNDAFPKSFMLCNVNRLELRTGFTKYDLVGMAALLKLTPNLEILVLDYLEKIGKDESLSEELLDKPVELSMPCLKQVTMKVYIDTDDEVNFIKMLVRQEVVLEKIVLVPGQVGENGKVDEKKSLPPMVFCRKDLQSWKHSLQYFDSELCFLI